MVVDGGEVGKFLKTGRVEMAWDWLVEVDFSSTVCLLDGAETHPVLAIARKHTVAPVDNRCHQVAFLVDVAHALLLNHAFGSRQQVVPHLGQYFLYLGIFLFGDRSAGIAFDTAFAEAFVEIAAEKLFDKVEADQCISDLQHSDFFFFFFHFSVRNYSFCAGYASVAVKCVFKHKKSIYITEKFS